MNLKVNAIILFAGILIGAFVVYKLTPEPVQIPSIKENKQVVRRTEKRPDGTVITVEQEKTAHESIPLLPPPKNHTIALIPKYRIDTHEAELGAMYTYKNIGIYAAGNKTGLKEIGVALSYSF